MMLESVNLSNVDVDPWGVDIIFEIELICTRKLLNKSRNVGIIFIREDSWYSCKIMHTSDISGNQKYKPDRTDNGIYKAKIQLYQFEWKESIVRKENKQKKTPRKHLSIHPFSQTEENFVRNYKLFVSRSIQIHDMIRGYFSDWLHKWRIQNSRPSCFSVFLSCYLKWYSGLRF